MKFRELAPRVITGAYILHAGLEKWNGDDARAEGIHGMATTAYPGLKTLTPTRFLRLLSSGEIATGTLLLAPFVPTAVAGAALTGFSGALLGLYFRIPGLRKEASIWPTQDGIAISKDSWMFAIGLGLLFDALDAPTLVLIERPTPSPRESPAG